MDNCTHHFKNTLNSSCHANFRLDIFHCKALLLFLRKEKWFKSWQKMQSIFLFEYLSAKYFLVWISVYIIMFLNQLGTSYSIMNVRVSTSMDELVNICSQCQQQNSLDTWTETISSIYVNWWFLVFGVKTWNFEILEHWLTTIEVRPRVYDMPKKMFI